MSAFDEPTPIDREAMIDLLYAFQASLKILVDQIASSRSPDIHSGTVHTLTCLHEYMLKQQPSLTRH